VKVKVRNQDYKEKVMWCSGRNTCRMFE